MLRLHNKRLLHHRSIDGDVERAIRMYLTVLLRIQRRRRVERIWIVRRDPLWSAYRDPPLPRCVRLILR